jgi:hypothetical protein
LCRLGIQGVRVLLLHGSFFCQVWLQHLSKIFDLWSSRCLLPPSSRHLGSLMASHFCSNDSTSEFVCFQVNFSWSPLWTLSSHRIGCIVGMCLALRRRLLGICHLKRILILSWLSLLGQPWDKDVVSLSYGDGDQWEYSHNFL